MAPIEVFFAAIVFVFALIGLARGFLRELGVTTVMMFLLFFLSQFEPYLHSGLLKAMNAGGSFFHVEDLNLVKCWLFTLMIVGAAFISYAGETLGFGGEPPHGPQGVLLGLLTGMLNGYLTAGSIWFYMDKFGYPITWLGFSADKLSDFASDLISFLPISFLGQPILLGQSLLLYLSVLLLIARVIR